jgi:hypothetical protein
VAMTPEGKVKAAVKELLQKHNVYSFMPVQNGMGKPGLDFHCVLHGVAFFIETKAPGGKPTPRQQLTMTEVQAAGAVWFVIDRADGLHELEDYLEFLNKAEPILRRIYDSSPGTRRTQTDHRT